MKRTRLCGRNTLGYTRPTAGSLGAPPFTRGFVHACSRYPLDIQESACRPYRAAAGGGSHAGRIDALEPGGESRPLRAGHVVPCLLYTSDAADDLLCVDLGGRRIIKKKKTKRF